jgi:hypothetical protein
MGRGCICSKWAGDVRFEHYLREVNNCFDTSVDTNAKLAAREEV